MSNLKPVVSIQCNWNEVLTLPREEVWISAKYLNANSVHEKIRTSVNKTERKLKIYLSNNYEFISLTKLSIVVKHKESDLIVAFVAATKAHNVHQKAVLSVSAAESALVVSSCEGHKLLVWDSRTNQQVLDLKGHGGPIYKCKFFPSGVVVLSAGADGSCKIWSAESGINPVTLRGHTMSVADICIVDRGRNVISVSKDGLAKLWDVGESKCLDNIIQAQGPINCCALAHTTDEITVENDREIATGNKLLIVGCESGFVICAHVAKRQEIFRKQLSSACNACAIIDQTIIAGCSDGKITLLNLKDGSVISEIHESASPILSIATLPNQLFIVGRQDGNCAILSLQEEYSSVRVQLTGSDCDGIRDIAFNGKWIFIGCRDTYIRKYDFKQIIVNFK
ncbi:unnamed protein product [Euphydryas editha]|uniref:Proteasomal ATPase-associated factor 1 n=1 Tax=Euphydryas editha TaxID=104508 RepID=A0AAU9UT13_EUPED|nr:unnamed protein product [Euphydryas editha]